MLAPSIRLLEQIIRTVEGFVFQPQVILYRPVKGGE